MTKKNYKIKPVAIFVWLIFLLGCVVFQKDIATAEIIEPNNSKTFDVKDIKGYKNWAKVNPKPLKLATPLDALCRMPRDRDLIETSSNPHRQKYFTVYVNKIGQKAMMTEKKPNFPVGSVIVKEKTLAEDSSSPELLTVMIKHKKGFNPETGDWEYMVVNGAATKIEGRGNLENCHTCHIYNKENDYIFRSYLTEKTKSALK
jgi:Cytochrome P460